MFQIKFSTQQLTRIALFAALIAVLSQISIPLPFSPVPFTGQTLGVFLAGSLLGGKAGLISVIIYLLLGAAGLPVFSMARGGLQVILGPTGGYLLGFIPGIYFLGNYVVDRGNQSNISHCLGMGVCLLFIYTLGALQLSFVMNLRLWQTLLAGVFPYIPMDLAKIALAIVLVKKTAKAYGKLQIGS